MAKCPRCEAELKIRFSGAAPGWHICCSACNCLAYMIWRSFKRPGRVEIDVKKAMLEAGEVVLNAAEQC